MKKSNDEMVCKGMKSIRIEKITIWGGKRNKDNVESKRGIIIIRIRIR